MKPSTLFSAVSLLLAWGVTPLYAQLTPSVAGLQKTISGNHYAGVIGEMTLIQTQTSPALTITQGYLQPNETVSQPNSTAGLSFTDHNIHIYPNPTQGELILEMEGDPFQQGQITLFDAGGKTVYQSSLTSLSNHTQHRISMQSFASGNYVLTLQQVGEKNTIQSRSYLIQKTN